MSNYRRNSIGSWTLTNRNKEKKIDHWMHMIDAYKKYDEYTKFRFQSQIRRYVDDINFQILLLKNDFTGIRANRDRYANVSIVKKIRVFVCCYVPIAERLYIVLKNKR